MTSRFQLLLKIASGGMGTVYLGQQRGAAGFQRLVAVKRAHPHLLEDASIVKTLVTEARLASLVRHPNVVGVIDVEDAAGELLLVMEYVEGASLAELNSAASRLPLGMAVRIILDACEGLHALHTARDEEGTPLGLVHRDVSPQNILIGIDGLARIADLGIARAYAVHDSTSIVRGKPGYMAPEYVVSARATPRTDVFALGVVAWETFTRQRLYRTLDDADDADILTRVAPPSAFRPSIPRALDAAVLKALARSPDDRYGTVRELAEALEDASRDLLETSEPASQSDVGHFVAKLFGGKLRARREMLREDTPTGSYVELDDIGVLDETPGPLATGPMFEVETDPFPPPHSRRTKAAMAGLTAVIVLGLGVSTALRMSQSWSEMRPPAAARATPTFEPVLPSPVPPPVSPEPDAGSAGTATASPPEPDAD